MANKLLKQIKYAIESDLQGIDSVICSKNCGEDILYLKNSNSEKYALALIKIESMPMSEDRMAQIIMQSLEKYKNEDISTVTYGDDNTIYVECKGGEEFAVYAKECKNN